MYGLLIVNAFLDTEKYVTINNMLQQAFSKYGIELVKKTNADILADTAATWDTKPDFAIFWDKDIRLCQYLESKGIKTFNNSKAIEICDDKGLTAIALDTIVKMPRTILAPMTFFDTYSSLAFLKEVEKTLGYPMVVKERYGSFGAQVYLARDYSELLEILIKTKTKPLLFQEYIVTSYGRDVRIQVVGDKVIASVMRVNEKDFIANVTHGGAMYNYTATPAQKEMALTACRAAGLDFGGVDILFGDLDEPIFCELNSNAHFKNLLDCTGVNAAEHIAEYIKNWYESK
ncbi:MAG: RimK family alpha-L-glutamate ligase [Clostridia bacterium]|nr:RimK family alpha-L-glutamate ligase [Clostridia bacterium]